MKQEKLINRSIHWLLSDQDFGRKDAEGVLPVFRVPVAGVVQGAVEMLHVGVNIDGEGSVGSEITFETVLASGWWCDVEILVPTVENEVVVVILFLLLLCFQCRHHFLDPFIQFRWRVAQRRAHAYQVSQILIGWINFILDVVSNMAPNGMSNN